MKRALCILVIVAVVGSGCGARRRRLAAQGTQDPMARCVEAPEHVLSELAGRLTTSGTLRNGFAVDSTDAIGLQFVSAELVREGRDPDRPGDILTWAKTADDYVAVDERARRHSDWPDADALDVTAEGAILSRACVHRERPDAPGGLLG